MKSLRIPELLMFLGHRMLTLKTMPLSLNPMQNPGRIPAISFLRYFCLVPPRMSRRDSHVLKVDLCSIGCASEFFHTGFDVVFVSPHRCELRVKINPPRRALVSSAPVTSSTTVTSSSTTITSSSTTKTSSVTSSTTVTSSAAISSTSATISLGFRFRVDR
ncbi:unnamed protein product [Cyprideis torosa]|uniref:Uncharacterized protein n=1 Tax=Cyprideis torosa TaxID=163714 RepID=A0A7R8W9F9_9CRUS|nr:unnamed protein product [Cyprideis torosa]CAG0889686.1 unnamed protein product [Cyprideis torosa]